MTSATPVANGATLPATVEALAATVVVVVVDATAAHLEGAAAADVAATVGDPGPVPVTAATPLGGTRTAADLAAEAGADPTLRNVAAAEALPTGIRTSDRWTGGQEVTLCANL